MVAQLLNYSVAALDDLYRLRQVLPPAMRGSALGLTYLQQLLERGVKFILPEGGQFLALDKLQESYFDLLRLPFPVTVLEIPWFHAGGPLIAEGALKEVPASRRIVVAWESESENTFRPYEAEAGLYFASVYFEDSTQRWLAVPLGGFIPRQNSVLRAEVTEAMPPSDQVVMQTLFEAGWAKPGNAAHEVKYFPLLPEFYDAMVQEVGATMALARMQLDLRDEMGALWEFCLTVNCSNVKQIPQPAPAALNKKRIKSGKHPLFDYRVLELPGVEDKPGAARESWEQEGHRASPRQHLRRGHPRRLTDGRIIFVRAAMVGSAAQGSVAKTYRIRS